MQTKCRTANVLQKHADFDSILALWATADVRRVLHVSGKRAALPTWCPLAANGIPPGGLWESHSHMGLREALA